MTSPFSGAGAVLLPRAVSGLVFLPAARRPHLQHARGVHPRRVPQARLPGGRLAEHLQRQALGDLGTLAALCREWKMKGTLVELGVWDSSEIFQWRFGLLSKIEVFCALMLFQLFTSFFMVSY